MSTKTKATRNATQPATPAVTTPADGVKAEQPAPPTKATLTLRKATVAITFDVETLNRILTDASGTYKALIGDIDARKCKDGQATSSITRNVEKLVKKESPIEAAQKALHIAGGNLLTALLNLNEARKA